MVLAGDKNARTSTKVYEAAASHIFSAPHVDLIRYNGNITRASRARRSLSLTSITTLPRLVAATSSNRICIVRSSYMYMMYMYMYMYM